MNHQAFTRQDRSVLFFEPPPSNKGTSEVACLGLSPVIKKNRTFAGVPRLQDEQGKTTFVTQRAETTENKAYQLHNLEVLLTSNKWMSQSYPKRYVRNGFPRFFLYEDIGVTHG